MLTLAKGLTALAAAVLISAALANAQTPTPSPKPTPPTAFGAGFKRWMDVDGFNLGTRYRFIKARSGATLFNQEQWQLFLKTRLKLDAKAKYSVVTVLASGQTFTTNWNDLGPGTGKLRTNVYVKQLFFDAKPDKRIELQFGGIAVNNGENSEATGFDNDNYITGERVVVRAPRHVWFDEISATNAYLGDTNRPSIFGRLHRLDSANYHQFLFRKQVTKEVGFSTDYTFLAGSDTIREAVRVKPKNFFLTTILFDAYQRVSAPVSGGSKTTGYGLDVFGEKVVDKHWTVSGGFARIDRRLTLNGDKFPPGKRLYATVVYKPSPEFSISPLINQAVGPLPTATTHRTRAELILTWNILESLHRHHVL